MERERKPWIFPSRRKRITGKKKARHDRTREEERPHYTPREGDTLADVYYAGYEEGYYEAYDEAYEMGYNDARLNRKNVRRGKPEKLRWHGRRSMSWYWL
jgi:hypothetical protein